MRRLSFSLLLTVVLACVVLGLGLNYLYDRVAKPDDLVSSQQHYIELGEQLAAYVSAMPEQERRRLSEAALEFAPVDEGAANPSWFIYLMSAQDFPIPESLSKSFYQGQPLVLEGDDGIFAHYYLAASNEVLVLTLAPAEVPQHWSPRLLFTLIFYCSISLVVLLWLWPLIRDLKHLKDSAQAYGQGQLDTRMSSHSWSYVYELEREFNRMADRIQALLSDNKLLSRAVSHDLKTPLARLHFGFEALASSDSAEQREKYLERINLDLEAMESLIETLLQFARLDDHALTLSLEPIDLKSLLKRACQRYLLDINENRHVQIELDTTVNSADYTVDGDKFYLNMMLVNIIGNAVRFAKARVNKLQGK